MDVSENGVCTHSCIRNMMMNHQIWKHHVFRQTHMENLPFMDDFVENNIGFHIYASSSRGNFDSQFMDDENPQ